MPGLLGFLPNRSSEGMSYLCSVNFLDLSDPISVTYHRNTKASYLVEHVSSSIDVVENDYFGLKYLDNNNLECWLDPTKSIFSQLKGVSNPVFYFRVKYYPADPDTVKCEATRYQLYLQVYKDFEEGRLICTLKDALVMSAYIVQGELGDYGGKTTFNETPISPDSSNSILSTPSTLSTSTPKSSRNPVVDYFKETRLPESMKSFHEDIQLLHKKLKGIEQSACERRFLKKASSLNSYGMHPYVVSDIKGDNLYLTLTPKGVVLFQDNIAITQYDWQTIRKTSFDGKLFYIKCYVQKGARKEGVPKEDKEETRIIAYRATSCKACKQLWKNSAAHKLFFTLMSSKEAPKVLHSGGLLSRGAKFRFSGKCLSEMNSENDKNFETSSYNRGVNKTSSYNKGVNKYATLPKGDHRMDTSHLSEDPCDASEDDKSIFNKTATSIVLNFLTTKTNTVKDTSPTNNVSAVETSNTVPGQFKEEASDGEEAAANTSSSLPGTSSTTPTQQKSFSSHLTHGITAATRKLKKFMSHGISKKTDPKKITKVVYADDEDVRDEGVASGAVNAVESDDIRKRNSIFEDADLLHGTMPTLPVSTTHSKPLSTSTAPYVSTKPPIHISTHPLIHTTTPLSTKQATHPSTLPISITYKNDFNEKLKEADGILPTLNTSTTVTSLQSTHSSIQQNHFDPRDNSAHLHTPNQNDNNNYFQENFNSLEKTSHQITRSGDNKTISKSSTIDSNRSGAFDGNDTGYLSGSDAFNHSFEGHRVSNIREFFNKKEDQQDIKEGSENAELTMTNSKEQFSGRDRAATEEAKRKSREELLNLLNYESSFMREQNNQRNEQASNKQITNFKNDEKFFENTEKNSEFENKVESSEKGKTKSQVKNDFLLPNLPDMSDLSPSTLSSLSTKGSTVVTPIASNSPDPDNTMSSIVQQAAPDQMGVLSDTNFERIKEIRKLLQENKDKIQEIRGNIETEIKTFAENSVKKELPASYKFCYNDGVQDYDENDMLCGGLHHYDDLNLSHSEDEDYKNCEAGEKDYNSGDDDGVLLKEYEECDEDSMVKENEMVRKNDEDDKEEENEDTIFIDRNYTTDERYREGKSGGDRKLIEKPHRIHKPTQIAFSTKHYEWYGENGVSSGGGGVIYTFCGGPLSTGDVKYPSDCGPIKSASDQEEDLNQSSTRPKEVEKQRKPSIGRSISSIEGIYTADNVHHYNPSFYGENEVINEAFMRFNELAPVEINLHNDDRVYGGEGNERVVTGECDDAKEDKVEITNKDELVKSKLDQPIYGSLYKTSLEDTLTKQHKDSLQKGKSQVTFSVPSNQRQQDVSVNRDVFHPIHLSSLDGSSTTSSLEQDVSTFDRILQEAKAISEKPFCKILTTKPEASTIKQKFDELNAKQVMGTYSACDFASDLDTLDRTLVEEDLVVPVVSKLLYDDGVPVKSAETKVLEKSTTELLASAKLSEIDATANNAGSKFDDGSVESDSKDPPQVAKRAKEGKCGMGTLITSSFIAIALFSVAMVILFETNKDKELFSESGLVGDFRSSFYEPCRKYVVCSIRKYFPTEFIGID